MEIGVRRTWFKDYHGQCVNNYIHIGIDPYADLVYQHCMIKLTYMGRI